MQGNQQIDMSQIDPDSLTEDDWDELVTPIIIEAMLDGRLPSGGDIEFSQLVQAGLELGIVVDCGDEQNPDLQLARDVEIYEQAALELSQEQQFQPQQPQQPQRQFVRRQQQQPGMQLSHNKQAQGLQLSAPQQQMMKTLAAKLPAQNINRNSPKYTAINNPLVAAAEARAAKHQ